MAGHVYHWKHGWIPLDHSAALAKAHGSKRGASSIMRAAHDSPGVPRSRREVAHAIKDLPNVPAKDRPRARRATVEAAHAHGAADLLPASARSKSPDRQYVDEGFVKDFAGGSAQAHIRHDATGFHFTPERQALHDKIIAHHLKGAKAQKNPAQVFLGGGPASGKSQASADANAEFHDAVTINPDDIKDMLPEYAKLGDKGASFVHEESSYLAKRITAEAQKRKAHIILDAVGDTSVDSMMKKVKQSRDAGYSVHLRYVTIPTDEAQSRSLGRTENLRAEGKVPRVVPPEYIAQSHASVSEVFPKLVEHADSASLHDNSNGWRHVLSAGNGQRTVVHDRALWNKFLGKAQEARRSAA